MRLLVLFCCLGLAVAAQIPNLRANVADHRDVEVLYYNSDNDGLGSYKYEFVLSDGTRRKEQAELRNAGTEAKSIAVKGTYSWTAPDGVEYTVNYIADEDGFRIIETDPFPMDLTGTVVSAPIPPSVLASLISG